MKKSSLLQLLSPRAKHRYYTHTPLSGQQKFLKGSAVQQPPWPLGNLGHPVQPGISIEATTWAILQWAILLSSSLGKFIHYLLLGKNPIFSVDFRVTNEGICFSSWIFNRIGCRTPQNIERIPSMNGAPPPCWRKTVKWLVLYSNRVKIINQ